MGSRREYEMTQEQLERILRACQPQPYIIVGGVAPLSPQENANSAWQGLAAELKFDWKTARPVPGKSNRFFTAESLED